MIELRLRLRADETKYINHLAPMVHHFSPYLLAWSSPKLRCWPIVPSGLRGIINQLIGLNYFLATFLYGVVLLFQKFTYHCIQLLPEENTISEDYVRSYTTFCSPRVSIIISTSSMQTGERWSIKNTFKEKELNKVPYTYVWKVMCNILFNFVVYSFRFVYNTVPLRNTLIRHSVRCWKKREWQWVEYTKRYLKERKQPAQFRTVVEE